MRKSPFGTTALMLAAAIAMAAASAPAGAQEAAGASGSWLDALAAAPPTWDLGDGWEARMSGFASGSAFTSQEQGGPLRGSIDDSGVTGQARVNFRIQHMSDSGLTLGARATIVAYHDDLSGDRYGNDTFEKLYVFAATAYGTAEIGQQDGAGARLGVTGPKVDDHVSLDDPDTAFFLDPDTGHRVDTFFYPYSAASASSNAAKFSFISTRLLGFQGGISFTPEPVKDGLPFIGNPADGPHQSNIWETALTYTGFISDDLAVDASAAYSRGYLQNGLPGMDDLYDWAVGAEAAYSLSEMKFTVGGAYRASNAYGFNPGEVLDDGQSRLAHVSAMAEWGSWRLGGEYSRGDINGPHALPDFKMDAWQVAGGYRLNDNMQLTAGWQWFNYDRDLGVFFNGRPAVNMNAGFVTLGYAL